MTKLVRRISSVGALAVFFAAVVSGCGETEEPADSDCTGAGCACFLDSDCSVGFSCELFSGTCVVPQVDAGAEETSTELPDVTEDTTADVTRPPVRVDVVTDDAPEVLVEPTVALISACINQCAGVDACDPPVESAECTTFCRGLETVLTEVDFEDATDCAPALEGFATCLEASDTCSEFVTFLSAEDELTFCQDEFSAVDLACLGADEGSGTPEEGSSGEGSAGQ